MDDLHCYDLIIEVLIERRNNHRSSEGYGHLADVIDAGDPSLKDCADLLRRGLHQGWQVVWICDHRCKVLLDCLVHNLSIFLFHLGNNCRDLQADLVESLVLRRDLILESYIDGVVPRVRCISGLYFEPRVIEGTKLEEVGGPEIRDGHFNLMLQGGDRIGEFDL